MINPTYWIEECRYILSVKVHRNNEQWTTNCADAPPGGNREEIRKKEASRVTTKRTEDARERDRAVETRVQLQAHNIKIQEAMANESILSSMKKRESATIKNAQAKLKELEKHKDIFVRIHGEDKYEAKVNELLMALIGAGDDDNTAKTDVVNKNNTTNDGFDDNDSSSADVND